MKKLTVWTIAIVGLFIALPVVAAQQTSKDTAAKKELTVKIGIIDTARIMRESKAARNAQTIFQKDLEAKRGILAAKEKEVRLLDEEMKSQDTKWSSEERNSKNDKMAKDLKELNRLKSDLEEELKKKDVELTRKLIEEVRYIVNDFSKKGNYSLILERSSVVAADDAVDITPAIIKLYDAGK